MDAILAARAHRFGEVTKLELALALAPYWPELAGFVAGSRAAATS